MISAQQAGAKTESNMRMKKNTKKAKRLNFFQADQGKEKDFAREHD